MNANFKPWEMPELSCQGRLPMHSLSFPFATAEAALADALAGPMRRDLSGNRWYQCLDGTWDFILFPSPDAVPETILAAPAPLALSAPSAGVSAALAPASPAIAGWKPIAVPGTWTVQGWDKPHYTNVIMPFAGDPPSVPAENPTGVYRRTFALPDGWNGRRTVLRVGSAESYLEAYVNGTMAGSSKDTRLPAEFDISPLVHPGENLIVLRVVRYSDASYIEDQDQWWYGGLHRSVCLYSTARVHLADADVRPSVSPDFLSGEIVARVRVAFGSGSASAAGNLSTAGGASAAGSEAATVRVSIRAPDGTAIAASDAPVDPLYQRSRQEVAITLPVLKPLLWNHETPNLYTAVISLFDGSGREIEHRACRIGFRTIEIKRRALLINGKRVLIKGVNRHEHDECMAKTLSAESMLQDVLLLKRNNFNAVRTSHYPNDERWYELCDEYGIYVMDEANIENHAYYDHISRDSRWAAAYLERMQRMVLRDRNHASIIAWSLGNESGYGQNHDMLAAWVRRFDPSRPVHYEGGVRAEWTQSAYSVDTLRRGKNVTDFVSPMYPTIDLIKQWDREVDASEDERPLIMCEYSHAMGNSNGSLSDYWEAIENSRGLQGGFIWDWIDQGILVDEKGKPVGPRGKSAAASGPAVRDSAGTPAPSVALSGNVRPDGSGPNAGSPLASPVWRYGGDFGDQPTDYDFCLNGLLFPDRTVKPAMAECFKLFQPIRFTSDHPASGRFTVENRLDFSDTSGLAVSWHLVDDSALRTGMSDDCAPELSGSVPLSVLAPGEKADIDVPALLGPEVRARMEDHECFVRFDVTLTKSLPWAEKGYRIGWEEFQLSSPAFAPLSESAAPAGSLALLTGAAHSASAARAGRFAECTATAGGGIAVAGETYRAEISPEGFLVSFAGIGSGTEFLSGPLEMNVYRAPTENDGLKNFAHVRGNPLYLFYYDKKAVYPWLDKRIDELTFVREGEADPAAADGKPAASGRFHASHRAVTASGAVLGRFIQDWSFGQERATGTFTFVLDDAVPEFPRVGLRANLSAFWNGVSWFGRGPGENYPDRKAGSAMGLYHCPVDGLYVPYTVPQENGCRTDVRSIGLFHVGSGNNTAGNESVRIESGSPCAFGISRFDPSGMWKILHADELVPMDGSILFVDAAIRGVGTATCGPDTLERYLVRPGVYRMSLSFSIVK